MFLTKKENIMAYLFVPPVVEYGPAGGHWLFWRYSLKHGVTVYKVGNSWYEEEYPSQDDLNEASVVYLGGHEHYVTAAQKVDLEAAGYVVSTV
jgi:hypothetical protein